MLENPDSEVINLGPILTRFVIKKRCSVYFLVLQIYTAAVYLSLKYACPDLYLQDK